MRLCFFNDADFLFVPVGDISMAKHADCDWQKQPILVRKPKTSKEL